MIKLEKVSKAYGKKTVLTGISCTFSEGEIYTVIAPNGTGKTTLLSVTAKIIEPDCGRVLFGDGYARNNIDIVLSGGRNLYLKNTVKENVYYFCVIKGMNRRQIETAIKAIKKYFPVYDELKNVVAEKLSYGQKRMLAIFIAIVSGAKCILLDEVTEGLDGNYVDVIKRMLKENGEKRIIIMASHDYDFAVDISDHIYFLRGGVLLKNNKFKDLDEFKRIYAEYYLSSDREMKI